MVTNAWNLLIAIDFDHIQTLHGVGRRGDSNSARDQLQRAPRGISGVLHRSEMNKESLRMTVLSLNHRCTRLGVTKDRFS